MSAQGVGQWRLLGVFSILTMLALGVWLLSPRLPNQAEGPRAGSNAAPPVGGTSGADPRATADREQPPAAGTAAATRPARSPGREGFERAYKGHPPWDIPGPQPAFVELEKAGEIRGSVLDVGCGTGEIALFLASHGHEVLGLDFVPVAIERARAKCQERGLKAQFQVGDALKLSALGRSFDNAVDSGLFHGFSNEDRAVYVAGLAQVIRPGGFFHVLCFSDLELPGQGPRRISQAEIRAAFRDGWQVEKIRETQFQTAGSPQAQGFSAGGPRAWLATIRRIAPAE